MQPAPTPHQAAGFRENREGTRMRSLFAIGKLVHDGRQYVCRVRNISDGGIGIRLDTPPAVGSRVLISLRGLPPTEAEIRWVEGQDAGLAFRRPISTDHISGDLGRMPRSPRFDLDCPATLVVGERMLSGTAIDVSLGGVKLSTPQPVTVGTVAAIGIGAHPDLIRGHVCWNEHGTTGFRFVAPLSVQRLAALLAQASDGARAC